MMVLMMVAMKWTLQLPPNPLKGSRLLWFSTARSASTVPFQLLLGLWGHRIIWPRASSMLVSVIVISGTHEASIIVFIIWIFFMVNNVFILLSIWIDGHRQLLEDRFIFGKLRQPFSISDEIPIVQMMKDRIFKPVSMSLHFFPEGFFQISMW